MTKGTGQYAGLGLFLLASIEHFVGTSAFIFIQKLRLQSHTTPQVHPLSKNRHGNRTRPNKLHQGL